MWARLWSTNRISSLLFPVLTSPFRKLTVVNLQGNFTFAAVHFPWFYQASSTQLQHTAGWKCNASSELVFTVCYTFPLIPVCSVWAFVIFTGSDVQHCIIALSRAFNLLLPYLLLSLISQRSRKPRPWLALQMKFTGFTTHRGSPTSTCSVRDAYHRLVLLFKTTGENKTFDIILARSNTVQHWVVCVVRSICPLK